MQGDILIIVTSSFSKRFVFKLFSVPAFSNSSGLESVFEKLRFHDGLVWTPGLCGKIKLFKFLQRSVDGNLNSLKPNELIAAREK